MAEAEYMVRATGYISKKQIARKGIVVSISENGTPIHFCQTLPIFALGPQMRRGIAELDGEGEVVGGVSSDAVLVRMRLTTIENGQDEVPQRIAEWLA